MELHIMRVALLDFSALRAISKHVAESTGNRHKCCTNSRRDNLFYFAMEKIGYSGWCRVADKGAFLFLHGFFFKESALMNNAITITITVNANAEPAYIFAEKKKSLVERKREKLYSLLKAYGVKTPINAGLHTLEKRYAELMEAETRDLVELPYISEKLRLKSNSNFAALAAVPISQFRELVRIISKTMDAPGSPDMRLAYSISESATGELSI